MICKFCHQPIVQTFATLLLHKKVHIRCEEFLHSQGYMSAFPFLEGMMYMNYLLEHGYDEMDNFYLELFYMDPVWKRTLDCDELLLWSDELPSNDALYLVFLLSNQALYWVFLQKPTWSL